MAGRFVATAMCMATKSHAVCVLRSTVDPSRYYTGLSTDVSVRISVHNSGGSRYTRELRPWSLVVALEFSDESSAIALEKYLKI